MKKLLFLAAFLICGCSQTNTATPPTQLSDGYVAYTVEGQRDSISDLLTVGDPGFRTLHASFDVQDSALSFNASSTNQNESIIISLHDFSQPGMYVFSHRNSGFTSYRGSPYLIDSTKAGSVEITQIDTSQKLISGSFQFVAKGFFDSSMILISSGTLYHVPYNH